MGTFLIWVIGKDQYSEGLIYYLSKLPNVLVYTTNLEYINDDVRILSPCDMNQLKADAIILPYTRNVSLSKIGKIELNEEFFTKQKDALFFSPSMPSYLKRYVDNRKIKAFNLFNLEETLKIKKSAIIDLIIYAIVENSELIIDHLDIGIVSDNELTPFIIEIFNKRKITYLISDKIENLLDQNIIILPSEIEISKIDIEKYKNSSLIFINLYEDNISFSLIKKGKIVKIYSLRFFNYSLLSYTYAFSNDIYCLLKTNVQQK